MMFAPGLPSCTSTADLKGELDAYIEQNLQGKVKLVRNEKREGLIRGRMVGASHATGDSPSATFKRPLAVTGQNERHLEF